MTIDRVALSELIEKGSDADLLTEMITFITSQLQPGGRRDVKRVQTQNRPPFSSLCAAPFDCAKRRRPSLVAAVRLASVPRTPSRAR